jgi:threonine/homoserine/homoserine lactone efflux protein
VEVDSQLAAFLSFTTVLVLTPGSTTAVVVRNTLQGGARAGITAAGGAALGNASHAAAAGLGSAFLFARWPSVMTVLTLAGAGFLTWLGLRSVYNVVRHPDGGLKMATIDRSERHYGEHLRSFRQGLAVNLLNPAIATFYLVVVPTFLPVNAPRWSFAALAAIHVSMALVCHGAWALGLDRLRIWFGAPLARRVLEGATGVALIALAIRVLLH